LQRLDLLFDQRQPRALALELGAQLRGHLHAVGLPPASPVAPADDDSRTQVVQHQQRADAVGVRGALVHQPRQFAVRAARVFVLRRRLVQHRPHALAGVVAQQHRQQLVAIEPVGLGTPGAPVHLDARGVDHDVVDALLDQPAVQPPAVAARLVARVHLGLGAQATACSCLRNAIKYGGGIAGVDVVPPWAAPAVTHRQFPRLVAELEAHVQPTLGRRILALQDCLGRRHFRSPLLQKFGNPVLAQRVSIG
jgi:hypothetical protein